MNASRAAPIDAASLSGITDAGLARLKGFTGLTWLSLDAPDRLENDYSDAGLDGTGVVVGISDTGIDEFSCYFRDPKGRVPRSSLLHPITDHSFRKVIQYVNYSGSDGDYRSGHGSHVAGKLGASRQKNPIRRECGGAEAPHLNPAPSGQSRIY